MKVLRVGPPSGRWRHCRVALESGPALRVRAEDVAALGLHAASELDGGRLAALRERAEHVRATEMALRLLAVRLRSRREVEERLQRRGAAPEVRRAVIDRLSAEGFLDDARFARAWIRGRLALRPSGGVRLRSELLRKGVAGEVVDQALRESVPETEERALALEVARSRFRRYRRQSAEVAYRRLAGVLHRRGFSAGAIAGALRELFGRKVMVSSDG